MKKWLALCSFAFILAYSSNAQIDFVSVEPVHFHNGDYGDGIDLTGYVTFDIYAYSQDSSDVLSSIYAVDSGDPYIEDASDLRLDFTGDVFQHEMAGMSSNDNNFFLWPTFPSMEYDTYLTFDDSSSVDNDTPYFWLFNIPTEAEVANSFEGPMNGDFFDGGDLWIDDGTLFQLCQDEDQAEPFGPDNKFRIGRVTTNDNFTGNFRFQTCCNAPLDLTPDSLNYSCNDTIFIYDGDVIIDTTIYICQELQFQCDPCIFDPVEAYVYNGEDILCNGDLGSIILETGESDETITYDASGIIGTLGGFDNVEIPVGAGSYDVTFINESGCEGFGFAFLFEPPLLELALDGAFDSSCINDANGFICGFPSGGTSPYTVIGTDQDFCMYDLYCGIYEVEVIDVNGCYTTEYIELECPEESFASVEITHPSSVDPCNGAINLDLVGISGNFEWTLAGPDGFLSSGESFGSGLFFEFQTELCSGNYSLQIIPEEGCVMVVDFSLNDTLEAFAEVTNESCADACDGSISVSVEGGVPSYSADVFDEDGNPVSFEGLCAGDYNVLVYDAEGTELLLEVEIEGPPAIDYSFETTNVSCNGSCDGILTLGAVTGGSGELLVEFNGGEFFDDGTNSGYQNICAGEYEFTITDLLSDCEPIVETVIITEPEALEVLINVEQILCNGDGGGTIHVSCIGGEGTVMIMEFGVACPSSFENLDPGIYDLTLQDESGCQATTSVEITEPDPLTIQAINIEGNMCYDHCMGTFDIEVNGGTEGYVFTLDGTQIANPPNNLCAGTYDLCVTDANGCQACHTFDIESAPQIQFLTVVNDITCTGMSDGSIELFTTGGTGIIEVSFDEDLDLTQLREGGYEFFAIDENGCELTETVTVGNLNPNPFFIQMTSSPESCWNAKDASATANSPWAELPVQIQWDDESAQTTSTATGLSSLSEYSVTIIDATGCEQTAETFIEATDCFQIAGALTPNNDGANDRWEIGGIEAYPAAKVQVFNRWGELLYETIGHYTPWDGKFNGNKVNVADYYYVIQYDPNVDPLTGTVTVKY